MQRQQQPCWKRIPYACSKCWARQCDSLAKTRLIYHGCDGRVAEWLMAPVLKTGVPERVSGVRIPPLPPFPYPTLTISATPRHMRWEFQPQGRDDLWHSLLGNPK